MFKLFGRPRKAVVAPKLKPRATGGNAVSVNRVALIELTPVLSRYLGQATCLQLLNFENLTTLISTAPTLENKTALVRVASLSLEKYQGLVAEIESGGGDAATYMEPFAPRIETFQHATRGGDWYEGLVTSYVTAGILDDFFIALAEGLSDGPAARIRRLLAGNEGSRIIVEQLSAATATNPRLASRLALWGRRLVGDTFLVARSALAVPANQHPDEARLEPVFTELIAAHTRRMDDLGLTA
ncbi:MAG: ferritin-like fold-containing protein [Homoserinimonas sp.]